MLCTSLKLCVNDAEMLDKMIASTEKNLLLNCDVVRSTVKNDVARVYTEIKRELDFQKGIVEGHFKHLAEVEVDFVVCNKDIDGNYFCGWWCFNVF